MFWDNFVSLCTKHNTNPNAVCALLGFSNATATHWKNGSLPRDTTIKKISDYFNVSIEFLKYGIKDENSLAATDERVIDEKLIQRLCKLTSAELVQVDAFVQGLLANR